MSSVLLERKKEEYYVTKHTSNVLTTSDPHGEKNMQTQMTAYS